MDPIAELRALYFNATKATIARDLARAIEILKAMPDEEARERVAVYMDGLSQMRSEWAAEGGGRGTATPGPGSRAPAPSRRRRR